MTKTNKMNRQTEYNVNPIDADGEIVDVHHCETDKQGAIKLAHELLGDFPAVTVEEVVYHWSKAEFGRGDGKEILALGCPLVLAKYAGEE